MSSTYLSPSLNFYNTCIVTISCISTRSVSAKLVYRFCFLALCWLACFSNKHFTPTFASRVATTPIPVSLWLGSRVVGLKYWWIPVLIFKNIASEEQWNLYSETFTVMLHKGGNIHYHCFSWNSRLTFNGSTSTCPLTTPTKKPHPQV